MIYQRLCKLLTAVKLITPNTKMVPHRYNPYLKIGEIFILFYYCLFIVHLLQIFNIYLTEETVFDWILLIL